jgi:L-glyceraldehyde 3-phosphate reductase
MGREMITEERLARVRALAAVAEGRGQTLAQLALVWARRDPRMTSLVIGASSVRQLEENLAALANPDLSDAEVEEIDRHATEADVNLWAASSSQ